MIDIAVPKGNEEEFIKIAKRIGLKGLVFLYKHAPKNRIAEKDFRIYYGLFAECRNDLKQTRQFNLVVSNNYSLFSDRKVMVLLTNEEQQGRDHIHQRRSGLNETMCRDYKEKIFALSFSKVLLAKKKAAVFGRQQQNAMLFNKFKSKVIIASFATSPYELRAPRDLIAYCRCLGLQKSKEAMYLLENQLK